MRPTGNDSSPCCQHTCRLQTQDQGTELSADTQLLKPPTCPCRSWKLGLVMKPATESAEKEAAMRASWVVGFSCLSSRQVGVSWMLRPSPARKVPCREASIQPAFGKGPGSLLAPSCGADLCHLHGAAMSNVRMMR